jgi:aquaporin Z
MVYAIGHISGSHLNPAVSVGLALGGRFGYADLPAYLVAQVLGAIAAARVLYFIASGTAGYDLAANGYGEMEDTGWKEVIGFFPPPPNPLPRQGGGTSWIARLRLLLQIS